jgi:predicted kinase
MDDLYVILITGLPCTGKTRIGRQIADYFGLPYLHKDGIKESLFDTLGWSDRAWSKKLGTASYHLLFYFTELLLAARLSLVLESNFSFERDGPKLHLLQKKYGFRAVEVQCVADGEELVHRFRQRWESGSRHPGHVDEETYDELRETLLAGCLPPLQLEGSYFEVDTTQFESVDVHEIIDKISLSARHFLINERRRSADEH